MIETCSLSSGSNGNSYYVKTGRDSFLVDMGIAYSQICQRLNEIGSDIMKINGIFITHEHTDHIKGLEMFSKKHDTPIYMTKKTLNSIKFDVNRDFVKIICADDLLTVNETTIESFSKNHDAADPVGFSFSHEKKKISIMTDFGTPCDNIVSNVKNSNIIFLESNYDDMLLLNGNYPEYLKKRIRESKGHMSNYDAGLLVLEHGTPELKYVFLSHLSIKNNNAELALETFNSVLSERKDLNVETIVATRNKVSKIIRI